MIGDILLAALAAGGGVLGAHLVRRRPSQPKHVHRWGEPTHTFTPPTNDTRSPSTLGADRYDRVNHGFTVTTQRCLDCGLVVAERNLGKVES